MVEVDGGRAGDDRGGRGGAGAVDGTTRLLPARMRLGSARWLAAASAQVDTCRRAAIADNVSPRCTTTTACAPVVDAGTTSVGGAPGEVVAPESCGTRSTCPA